MQSTPATFEPRIVAFLCNWCSYTGADLAGTARMKYLPNVRPSASCAPAGGQPVRDEGLRRGGRRRPGRRLPHPSDCHYQEGNFKASEGTT